MVFELWPFKGGFDATKKSANCKVLYVQNTFFSAWSLKEIKLSTSHYYTTSNLYPAENILVVFYFQGVNTSSNLKNPYFCSKFEASYFLNT